IGFLHRTIGEPWPDVSDYALLSRLDEWFAPFQTDARGLSEISAAGLSNGLMSLVPRPHIGSDAFGRSALQNGSAQAG
ncbi:hypothetical protein ACC733_38605, partial [Rhizobium johnstonii]|uniref:hypothetical protein n=1 Tax=Rhizobium johnstonii TaxID=3019933 RepID=UPI003F9707F3